MLQNLLYLFEFLTTKDCIRHLKMMKKFKIVSRYLKWEISKIVSIYIYIFLSWWINTNQAKKIWWKYTQHYALIFQNYKTLDFVFINNSNLNWPTCSYTLDGSDENFSISRHIMQYVIMNIRDLHETLIAIPKEIKRFLTKSSSLYIRRRIMNFCISWI